MFQCTWKKVSYSTLVSICWCIISACVPKQQQVFDSSDCLSCHAGIETISKNHPFACKVCHILEEPSQPKTKITHADVIRNPSDPLYVQRFCGSCHMEEIKNLETSLHATMAGIINQTRYLWGAQKKAYPPIYTLNQQLKTLPKPPANPEKTEELVDDFLRKKCLRCHIYANGSNAPGLYRSSGCAACHMVYNNNGTYMGGDKIISKKKPGYPMRHLFEKKIPNAQCLHCHNHNHVGGDYEGYFEHDFDSAYRSPLVNGRVPTRIYGIEQHRLQKDIHYTKNLLCIDCHSKSDVMGDGNLYGFALEVPMKTCRDCHKNYNTKTPSHNPKWHKRLRCSACHAQWSYQDYGMSVMRRDFGNLFDWKGLRIQADPSLEILFTKYSSQNQKNLLFSKDLLDDQMSVGVWLTSWRFRRWEFMPLGVDHKNQISILRPRHQFHISYQNRWGDIVLSNEIPLRRDGRENGWAFTPYVPHTISPIGRGCKDCHQNPFVSGQGLFPTSSSDLDLMRPSPPTLPFMRLLNKKELNKLLQNSEVFRRAWYKKLQAYHPTKK